MLLVLTAMAIVSLRPWEANSLIPGLTVSPGLGSTVPDDSVAVAPAQTVRADDVHLAEIGSAKLVAEPASDPDGRLAATPQLGVAEGRPVSVVPSNQVPEQPVAPQPPAQPVAVPVAAPAEPSPAPASSPVSAPGSSPTVVAGIDEPGEGNEDSGTSLQLHEGDEYFFSLSFYIETMVYGWPGVDNLIMRFKSDTCECQTFGLQLWDSSSEGQQAGERGLWASGEAMGGDRFLAPAPEQAWHDVVVRFKASSEGEGFYEIYLDGVLVDARNEVSLIAAGSSYTQADVGLLRDAGIQGASEIRLGAAKLGNTLESVLPE